MTCISIINMAAVGESTCHSDPNFAVVCSFLEKYGELLGLPDISFVDLQHYLEDTKSVSKVLIDIHVRLLKRIGKTNVNHERFERSITKFCFYFSDLDGWELDRFGYRFAPLSTKLRILKNLLECQFDYNIKFKEKINELGAEEMRFLPVGRDRDGMTYWYLLDKDMNVFVYREEPDDENAESWKLLCSDRRQLSELVDRLRNNTHQTFVQKQEEEEDKSSLFTDESKTTSKEGSPDREAKPPDIPDIRIKLEAETHKCESSDKALTALEDQRSHTDSHAQNSRCNVDKEDSENNVCEFDITGSGLKMTIRKSDVKVKKEPEDNTNQKVVEKEVIHDKRPLDVEVFEKVHREKGKTQSNLRPSKKSRKSKEMSSLPGISSSISTKGHLREAHSASNNLPKKGKENGEEKHQFCLDENSTHNIAPVSMETANTVQDSAAIATEIAQSVTAEASQIRADFSTESFEAEQISTNITIEKAYAGSLCDGVSMETERYMQNKDDKFDTTKIEQNKFDLSTKTGNAADNVFMETIKTQNIPAESMATKKLTRDGILRVEIVEAGGDNVGMLNEVDKSVETAKINHDNVDDLPMKVAESRVDHIAELDLENLKSKQECVDSPKEITSAQNVIVKSEARQAGCDVSLKISSCSDIPCFPEEASKNKTLENSNCEVPEAKIDATVIIFKEKQQSHEVPSTNTALDLTDKCAASVTLDQPFFNESQSEKEASVEKQLSIQMSPSIFLENNFNLGHKQEEKQSAQVSDCYLLSETEKLKEKSSINSVSCEKTNLKKNCLHEDRVICEDGESRKHPAKEESNILKESDILEEKSDKSHCYSEGGKNECLLNSSLVENLLEQNLNVISKFETSALDSIVENTSFGSKELKQCDGSIKSIIMTPKGNLESLQSNIESVVTEKVQKPLLTTDYSEKCETSDASVKVIAVKIEMEVSVQSLKVTEPITIEESATEPKTIIELATEHMHVELEKGIDLETSNDSDNGYHLDCKTKPDAGYHLESEQPCQVESEISLSSVGISKIENSFPPKTVLENETLLESQNEIEANKLNNSVEEINHDMPVSLDNKTKFTIITEKEKIVESEKNIQVAETQKSVQGKECRKPQNKYPASKCMQDLSKTEEALERKSIVELTSDKYDNIKGIEAAAEGNEADDASERNSDTHTPLCDRLKETSENLQNGDFLPNEVQSVECQNMCRDNISNKESKSILPCEQVPATIKETEKITLDENKTIVKGMELKWKNIETDVNLEDVPEGTKILYEEKKVSEKIASEGDIASQEKIETENLLSCGVSAVVKPINNLPEQTSLESHKSGCVISSQEANNTYQTDILSDNKTTSQDGKRKDLEGRTERENIVNKGKCVSGVGKLLKQASVQIEKICFNDNIVHLSKKRDSLEDTETDSSIKVNSVIETRTLQSESLVNGHCDLARELEEQNGLKIKRVATAPRRGRGGRGRGSRKGGNKRSAPEPLSDEANSEPLDKRPKRGGGVRRGARGGRGRTRQPSKRFESSSESSSDGDVPLVCMSSRARRGHGKKFSCRGGQVKKIGVSAERKNEDSSSSDDLPLSKAAKKKKIVGEDSSDFEPDEPVTPAKKSHVKINQKNKTIPTSTASAEKDILLPNTRRSLRLMSLKKKEPDPHLDFTSEEEKNNSTSSEVNLSSEEDSQDDDFKPQGRNRQRQAALKKKEEKEVPMDDTPCQICEKCTHPDMMLLCDGCDNGFHMACLRPPLMVIPEGDWFCPTCEHTRLIAKLSEYLQALETSCKKKERLVRRKERLAFVGISLDNILKEERKVPVKQEYILEEYSPRTRPNQNKNSRRSSHNRRSSVQSRKREMDSDREYSPLPKEVYTKRSCRTRTNVSYQFKEFDELISRAIEEDKKPPKPPKPPGIGRGKDMSNILGMDSDEEKEMIRKQKEEEMAAEAANGRPPPVIKKKPRRRLTTLDSDDNPEDEDEDDSDEFRLSESDEDSEASADRTPEDDASEDSGDWQPQNTWYKGTRRKSRNGGHWSRNFDDFVVEDDDSDDYTAQRRSTRNSSKRRIHYRDWESDTEEESEEMETEESEASMSDVYSSDSDKKRGRRKFTSKSDSSSSEEYIAITNRAKRRRMASSGTESDSDPRSRKSSKPFCRNNHSKSGQSVKTKSYKSKPKPAKQSITDDSATEIENEAEEEIVPKKKKNVLRDSSSERDSDKTTEGVNIDEDDEETEIDEESIRNELKKAETEREIESKEKNISQMETLVGKKMDYGIETVLEKKTDAEIETDMGKNVNKETERDVEKKINEEVKKTDEIKTKDIALKSDEEKKTDGEIKTVENTMDLKIKTLVKNKPDEEIKTGVGETVKEEIKGDSQRETETDGESKMCVVNETDRFEKEEIDTGAKSESGSIEDAVVTDKVAKKSKSKSKVKTKLSKVLNQTALNLADCGSKANSSGKPNTVISKTDFPSSVCLTSSVSIARSFVSKPTHSLHTVPNFLNIDQASKDESHSSGTNNLPPYASPPSGMRQPTDVGFRPPTDSGFRPSGDGGFRPSSDGGFRRPVDSNFQSHHDAPFRPPEEQSYQASERMGFQPPFPHGPYPLPGEQLRGPGSENYPSCGSGDFYHIQGIGPYGPLHQGSSGENFKSMHQGPEGFQSNVPEGFHKQRPEGFHSSGSYPQFRGHSQQFYPPPSRQPFQGHPSSGYGMFAPQQYPRQNQFRPGPLPAAGPYHPMGPPVSQIPGGPPSGRGGFMIDNLLRTGSGGHSFSEEVTPAHMPTPQMSSPHMTPSHISAPQITSSHMTPPHVTPPHITPPQMTPSQMTPPQMTPPHMTPPPQQPQQRLPRSPRSPTQDEDDMGDVSDIKTSESEGIQAEMS